MIVTILAEPRSGSTNLANWFSRNKNFTVLQEPLNKNGIHYKKNTPIDTWVYDTDYLLIKEIYTPNANLEELINLSDKVILLYRINVEEQMESWLVASETNNWSSEWSGRHIEITNKDIKIDYFNKLKSGFKNDYLDNPNFFNITYEELYGGDGFEKVINYLNIDSVENKDFPYGKKYKILGDRPTKLI